MSEADAAKSDIVTSEPIPTTRFRMAVYLYQVNFRLDIL
jgi:hypothetical protein